VDTNCDPDEADFVIPGNDDAICSCSLVVRAIADGIAAGKARVTPTEMEAPQAEQEEEAEEAPATDEVAEAPEYEQTSQGETAEGEVLATVSGSVGALVAIGCESEPVSKVDEFLRFAETVLEAVESGGPEAVGGLEELRLELIGQLGENIEIRGASRMKAGDG